MPRPPPAYWVCTDVRWPAPRDKAAGARRLARVYKIMRGFGDPVQKSVFRCVLSDVQRAHLEDKLEQVIKKDVDQVLFVHLGTADARSAWRTPRIGRPLLDPERVCKIVG